MAKSILYRDLSLEGRLKVKKFFYQTILDCIYPSATDYEEKLERMADVFEKMYCQKRLEEIKRSRGRVTKESFDELCDKAGHGGIYQENYRDKLWESVAKSEYPLYQAIVLETVQYCCKKRGKNKDVPFVSAIDYERLAGKLSQKISNFGKESKIRKYMQKKCARLDEKLTDQSLIKPNPKTKTSNTFIDNHQVMLVQTHVFSVPKDGGAKIMQ